MATKPARATLLAGPGEDFSPESVDVDPLEGTVYVECPECGTAGTTGQPLNACHECGSWFQVIETEPEPNTSIQTFDDGSIRFQPQFTKDEAGYRETDAADFDPSHDRCGDCVHYIPENGCHLVQGDIDPEDYCAEFYADYGVFAHEHDQHVEVNFEMRGRKLDFEQSDIQDFVDEIEERLQQQIR